MYVSTIYSALQQRTYLYARILMLIYSFDYSLIFSLVRWALALALVCSVRVAERHCRRNVAGGFIALPFMSSLFTIQSAECKEFFMNLLHIKTCHSSIHEHTFAGNSVWRSS